ncbi:MAG TPA: M48 family metalloprotease, partial [Puia sp.]|nr:M48 family metalloprotease [Puia sp.]
MSKFIQITIVILYTLFSATIVFDIMKIAGFSLRPATKINLICLWTTFCFLSNWFLADFKLFWQLPVRKPILSEEQKLEKLFSRVLENSSFSKKIRLRICEEKNLNAYATGRRTIFISRKIFETFSDDELQGVMAHELGHLQDRDCLINAAFIMALIFPFPFYFALTGWINKGPKKDQKPRPLLSLARLLTIILFFILMVASFRHNQILLFLIVLICMKAYPNILRLTLFSWRAVTRFIEYKQDAYAHSLGLGNGLKKALEK